jgi:hypothetical protein
MSEIRAEFEMVTVRADIDKERLKVILGSAMNLAQGIVKLTSTEVDNKIVDFLAKFVDNDVLLDALILLLKLNDSGREQLLKVMKAAVQ